MAAKSEPAESDKTRSTGGAADYRKQTSGGEAREGQAGHCHFRPRGCLCSNFVDVEAEKADHNLHSSYNWQISA